MSETYLRSWAKSVGWRVTGVFMLALITWAFTRNKISVGLVTMIHHTVFLVVYYLHERIWLRFPIKPHRALLKMITYETICGTLILGIISYAVTGSWQAMTAITLTYIAFKHILYIGWEDIWDKIYWGRDVF